MSHTWISYIILITSFFRTYTERKREREIEIKERERVRKRERERERGDNFLLNLLSRMKVLSMQT